MGFLILGFVLIIIGILGFVTGQIILEKKKRLLKDKFKKLQEE